MRFFDGCATAQQIKNEYKRLVKIHHPDLGGDEETMKAVNAAYQDALKRCTRTGSHYEDRATGDTVERPYVYGPELEALLAEKLTALVLLAEKYDIHVSLLGTWIWVEGDTKSCREELKAIGLTWNSVRLCWCFNGTGRRSRRSDASLDELKVKYQAATVRRRQSKPLAHV